LNELQRNEDFLLSYMAHAPWALAFERALECQIYTRLSLRRPVLDLGCGEGLFAKVFFAEQIETGVDPNPKELARARVLGAHFELIECPGDRVPKPDASYNTIFSNSVLEHIPILEPVFREVHRLLAPGGRFYFTVPSDRFNQYTVVNQLLGAIGLHGLAARYRKAYDAFWGHYHAYPEEEWTGLGRRCGFEIVRSHTYDPKWTCLLNDLLVPLSAPMFLLKRLANRWTLFPPFRRLMVYPFFLLARRILSGCDMTSEGGLVFVALAKPGVGQ
jgi:SAM-dependent methyltransferase